MSGLPLSETTNATPKSTKLSEHVEHTLELDYEIHSEALRRGKKQRTVKFFGDDFIFYLTDESPKSMVGILTFRCGWLQRSCP
jgi:hypothetical protein